MTERRNPRSGDTLPVRAFRTDPSWYTDYWCRAEPPATPVAPRRYRALTAFVMALAWMHRLVGDHGKLTEHAIRVFPESGGSG